MLLFLIAGACSQQHAATENEQAGDSARRTTAVQEPVWQAPDTGTIPRNEFGEAVRYGRKLIMQTSLYLGPEGIVSKNLGTKMNCSNCHLDGGTRPYAFSFFSTHARYPQYRGREGRILSLSERVNNCIERPMSGKPLKLDSREMDAIICYIKWVGQNVPVDKHVKGDQPLELTFPGRAADPARGKVIYDAACRSCHGDNGEGKMQADNVCYQYPPLWGVTSYQPGSSLHRVIKAAAFIYANMPNGKATYAAPSLTMEQAFDVAAFINDDDIHKRPTNNGTTNYPNSRDKPVDYGKGPYTDTFAEVQHKYGPFQPIIDFKKSKGLPVIF